MVIIQKFSSGISESEQIRAVLQKGLHNSLVNSSLLSEQNENIEGVLR